MRVLGVTVLLSCVAVTPGHLRGQERSSAPGPATGAAGGVIELEPLPAGPWTVTYRLERPATALRFARAAQFFREEHWTVRTPGWRLDRDGDSQILTGDAPADVIELEMARHDEVMRAEYRAFQPLSDGSFALYTGHLYVRDIADEARADELGAAPYLTTLAVVPPPGTNAVVLGNSRVGRFEWTDPHASGTYLYFGGPPTLETEHVTAVLDPGLPQWLAESATTLFPIVFEALADGFDESLPWHPSLLVAWDGAGRGGRNWSGGALPAQIRMSLEGSGWERQDPAAMVELARFIAHEAAHFWNGQIVVSRHREQSWIHEGGADAIAELALRELGLIDAEALHSAREVAINRCLGGLAGGSINGSEARGRFQDYYQCGHLMAVWAEAALAQADPGGDLFRLWARLIDAVGPGGRYDQERYLSTLSELGVDAEVTDAMRRFAEHDLTDQLRTATEEFARVGARLAPDGSRPPTPLRLDLARGAVTHLMSTSCDGRYSLSTYDRYLRVYAIADCAAFQAESDVSMVAGHPVTDGDLVYDAVVDACSTGSPLTFENSDGAAVLTVWCEAALAPRAPWLSLALRR